MSKRSNVMMDNDLHDVPTQRLKELNCAKVGMLKTIISYYGYVYYLIPVLSLKSDKFFSIDAKTVLWVGGTSVSC